jgi:hypothetical protein
MHTKPNQPDKTTQAIMALSLALLLSSTHALASVNNLKLLSAIQEHAYRDNDDLLTAGLGEKGLRSPQRPNNQRRRNGGGVRSGPIGAV